MDCHLSYNVSAPPRHYKNDNPSRFIYKNDIVIKTTIAYKMNLHCFSILGSAELKYVFLYMCLCVDNHILVKNSIHIHNFYNHISSINMIYPG